LTAWRAPSLAPSIVVTLMLVRIQSPARNRLLKVVVDSGRLAQEPAFWMNSGSSLATSGVPEPVIAGSRNRSAADRRSA
jgi:hypothetical protein